MDRDAAFAAHHEERFDEHLGLPFPGPGVVRERFERFVVEDQRLSAQVFDCFDLFGGNELIGFHVLFRGQFDAGHQVVGDDQDGLARATVFRFGAVGQQQQRGCGIRGELIARGQQQRNALVFDEAPGCFGGEFKNLFGVIQQFAFFVEAEFNRVAGLIQFGREGFPLFRREFQFLKQFVHGQAGVALGAAADLAQGGSDVVAQGRAGLRRERFFQRFVGVQRFVFAGAFGEHVGDVGEFGEAAQALI